MRVRVCVRACVHVCFVCARTGLRTWSQEDHGPGSDCQVQRLACKHHCERRLSNLSPFHWLETKHVPGWHEHSLSDMRKLPQGMLRALAHTTWYILSCTQWVWCRRIPASFGVQSKTWDLLFRCGLQCCRVQHSVLF